DPDVARQRIVEAIDQADDRRLSGAGWPDDRGDLARLDPEADVAEDLRVAVPEADAIEVDVTLEARPRARARQIAHAALHREQLLAALVADRRLRDRVRHLRQLADRFVELRQVEQKQDQDAGADLAAEREASAVPQHEARSDRDDHRHRRREPGFHRPRLQTRFDVALALRPEAAVLAVLPR